MRLLLIGLLAFSSTIIRADTITVPVPGENWSVMFSVPELIHFDKPKPGDQLVAGRGSRVNVTLSVGPASCEDGATSDQYTCMRKKIEAVPGVALESIKVERRSKNVQISYVRFVKLGELMIQMMHTNVLFQKEGKWVNLHASTRLPKANDVIAGLLTLGESAEVSER